MEELEIRLSADGGSLAAVRADELVAQGRLRRAGDHWETDAALLPGHDDVDALIAVLRGLGQIADRTGSSARRWIVSRPTTTHDRAGSAVGLDSRRDLLQLRRSLPVEASIRSGIDQDLAVRPFRPGVDDRAWLQVNNRSFAGHPDQSEQMLEDLRPLLDEPWFDQEGFLVLDAPPEGSRAGELDGFCWTKVHPPAVDHDDPALGEIFVIGVDPAAQGRGLGPALTLAGLDHLAAIGLSVGMLYVDLDNTAAVKMYERLGFRLDHVDRIYEA